jgi:hypothetical protein
LTYGVSKQPGVAGRTEQSLLGCHVQHQCFNGDSRLGAQFPMEGSPEAVLLELQGWLILKWVINGSVTLILRCVHEVEEKNFSWFNKLHEI